MSLRCDNKDDFAFIFVQILTLSLDQKQKEKTENLWRNCTILMMKFADLKKNMRSMNSVHRTDEHLLHNWSKDIYR
jgi:hypothetical protein